MQKVTHLSFLRTLKIHTLTNKDMRVGPSLYHLLMKKKEVSVTEDFASWEKVENRRTP